MFDLHATPQAEGEAMLSFEKFADVVRFPYARNNQAKIFSDFLFAPVQAMKI